MRIRFASPLAKILGQSDCDLVIHRTTTVEEVVGHLSREFAQTQVFASHYPGKPYVPHILMVIKNGRYLLKPHDCLENHDDLEIIPPIMGG